MDKRDFSKVPAAAFQFGGGPVTFAESNGDYPIKMLARSAQPIEHWFWGRIVHDMKGIKLHKQTIPVDYLHDEEIGYLNKFSTGPAGLLVEGALVPTNEPNDPARKLIARSKGGVPYEASINWAGDGAVLEQVPGGFAVEVNGYRFEGPGIVVREWPLRGVAVCPYGADMNTESQFADSDKHYSVQIREANEVLRVNTLKQKEAEPKSCGDPQLDAAKALIAAQEKEIQDLREVTEHREQVATLHGEQNRLKAEIEKLERKLANKGKGLVHAIGRKCGFSMEPPKDKPAEPVKGFTSKIRISGKKPGYHPKDKGPPAETGEKRPIGLAGKIRIAGKTY